MDILKDIPLAQHNLDILAIQIANIPNALWAWRLLDYNDNITGKAIIEVLPAWNAADEIVLDALIAANTAAIILVDRVLESKTQSAFLLGAISTNSLVFQPVLSHTLNSQLLFADWLITIDFRFNVTAEKQGAEFQYKIDGVPQPQTHAQEQSKNTAEWLNVHIEFEILNLPKLATKQIDFEYRKIIGGALVSLTDVKIASNRIVQL